MNRKNGFSLIEMLVSMVVLSVGTLSMGSLQVLSSRNVQDAAQRMEAAHLANGFLERLRANNSVSALQTYAGGAVTLGGGAAGAMPSPNCYGADAACSPTELARFDLWLWEQLLDGTTEQLVSGGRSRNTGGLMNPTACLTAPAAGAGAAGNYTLAIAYRSTVELPENPDIACGRGALFDDGSPLYGTHNEFRRIVLVQAFIMPVVSK